MQCNSYFIYTIKWFTIHGYELFNCPVNVLVEQSDSVINGEEFPVLPEPLVQVVVPLDVVYLGKLIRKVRKQQKLTIEEVSGASALGLRFIKEVEYGKETAQIGKVLHLLQMLGIKMFITNKDTLL